MERRQGVERQGKDGCGEEDRTDGTQHRRQQCGRAEARHETPFSSHDMGAWRLLLAHQWGHHFGMWGLHFIAPDCVAVGFTNDAAPVRSPAIVLGFSSFLFPVAFWTTSVLLAHRRLGAK